MGLSQANGVVRLMRLCWVRGIAGLNGLVLG